MFYTYLWPVYLALVLYALLLGWCWWSLREERPPDDPPLWDDPVDPDPQWTAEDDDAFMREVFGGRGA